VRTYLTKDLLKRLQNGSDKSGLVVKCQPLVDKLEIIEIRQKMSAKYYYRNYFDLENIVEHAVINESRLKEILKSALIEVFEERKSLFSDLLAEALEDIALIRAIKEGESTASVSRDEVFSILEGKA